MDTYKSPVNLVVAHAVEAKPIVEHFNLDPISEASGFPRYEAPGFRLIVSGIGRVNAAAATSYLAAITMNESPYDAIWLNVGIAGHKTCSIGEVALIRKISEQEMGRSYYPLPIKSLLSSSDLITVDLPEQQYAQDSAYDMEGSAFWSVATKFSALEFVQLVKVISDNPDQGIDAINPDSVLGYMSDLALGLDSVIDELQTLAVQHNSANAMPSAYDALTAKIRFTVTQHRQLRRACQRFQATGLEDELERLSQSDYRSAKLLLSEMTRRLDRLVV